MPSCRGLTERGENFDLQRKQKRPRKPAKGGDVAIKVVQHVVFSVINFYTYSAMKYKTGIEMGIIQLLT